MGSRREFTLQMYDGGTPEPDESPAIDAGFRLEDRRMAPTWRCSGCLMAWGVYRPPYQHERPQGNGCRLCDTAAWFPDNSGARVIDAKAGLDTHPAMQMLHPAAWAAAAAVETTAQRHDLHGNQSMLRDVVIVSLDEVLRPWVAKRRKGMIILPFDIEFVDDTMSVTITLVDPRKLQVGETFCVRYRWV